jgi:hypothetical protein
MSRAHARIAVAAAAAAWGLVGCSSAAVDAPAAPPVSSAPATFTPGPALDEESACVALVPVLQDAATAILAISDHPDGSTVDRDKLDAAIAALQKIKPEVPASMRGQVDDQIGPLVALQTIFRTGQNQQLDLQAFRTSGTALGTTCLKYAH